MSHIKHPMRRLFVYLRRYRDRLLRATTSSILNKILDLMPPFLTAWLIDSVSGQIPVWISDDLGIQDPWEVVIFISIATIIVFGGESFFEWGFKRDFMRLAQTVQHDLRLDAYSKLQERELAYFENERTGNLMAVLNDDINQLERFLNTIFNEIIQLVTLFLFAGWALCQVSLPLGLLGMIPIPFILLGSLYYQRKISPYYKEVREGVGQLGARLENNLSGILVIKSFTAEAYEKDRVHDASTTYRDANFRAIRWSAVYVPLIRILIALGFAGTLALGAWWVIHEPTRFSLGSLAFFAMMIQRLLWPVTRLGTIFDEYERARAATRRVFGLIDSTPRLPDPTHPLPLPQDGGNIALENISFGYQPEHPVIKQVNLHVPKGHTIGIAGPTGSGKTTLIKLLLRLYDVQQGRITVGGIDIRQVTRQSLRKSISLVSQEVYLFHGTIFENIQYGNQEASREVVLAAAQKAALHDFIVSLPEGYNTIVGERGLKLSGGQRQRLSIARAIVKDAPILILDEATSAVDTETEKIIQSHINELATSKTAIIIAHRLSTIRQADTIVVLHHGKIEEMGTHEA
ncbi:MAG: ABC transporter ATP-binding protein [Saprospiraceae bacterium]|nr:ABC transporter ATP-binding protein [Saprospiraceae bacterium]